MANEQQRAKWRAAKERQKKRDIEKYTWQTLKNNTARRNRERVAKGQEEIKFELTLEQFREFCRDCDYIRKKGRKSKSITIDRIGKHYTIDGIRAVTNGDNVRLMMALRYDWDERKRQMVFWHDKSLANDLSNDESVPF